MLSIAIISCQKDDVIRVPSETATVVDDTTFLENFGAIITTNFIGKVVDVNGIKLINVLVTIGNQTTMTDHNGVFILNNTSVYEKFAFIKATKNGYIQGSRSLIPTANGTNDVQITLLEKNIVGTINSGEASEVFLPNGSKVSFQGDFINSSGATYNGQVEVSLHYLEPNQQETFTQMPGMLFGKCENGSASGMETYGMLAVNLYSSAGEELNILETSPATMTFPVSTTTPNAPENIPLWYFDEVTGYWKEQGLATKVGNEYIAEVSHFTWWNVDIPLDTVNVCFTLQASNNLPNFYFEIIRNQTQQTIFTGYTNDNGEACGLFPANEEMTINIYGDCTNDVIYTQAIGSYASDVTVTFIIPSLPSELIETNLSVNLATCSGSSLINGYAIVSDVNNTSISEIISIVNGVFNNPFVYCNGESYTMVVHDSDSQQNSDVINLSLAPLNTVIGDVLVCGNETVLIGSLVAGGVVFYIAPVPTDLDGDGFLDEGLVVALSDFASQVEWGCYQTDLPNVPNVELNNGNPIGLGTAIGYGAYNTTAMLNDCPNSPAALAAGSLGAMWFLPSFYELNEIYLNRATLETVTGVNVFSSANYWSSTEFIDLASWYKNFDNGNKGTNSKSLTNSVRAIRAF